MLLRSSSTPVFGSLHSSLSDSLNVIDSNNNKPPSCSENLKKLSFYHGGHSNFHGFSCNSSPICKSLAGLGEFGQGSCGLRGFRRAQSDGNLEGLAGAIHAEELPDFNSTRNWRRPHFKLEPIPSFSVYNSGYNNDDDDDDDEEEEEEEEEECIAHNLQRSISIGGFSFANEANNAFEEVCDLGDQVALNQSNNTSLEYNFEGGIQNSPLFLARGLGVDLSDPAAAMAGGGSGGNGFLAPDSCGDGPNFERYYQRMLEEDPCNSLLLRNYAQYLYQEKKDSERAEEFYSRAILVEPGDGEILSQYAKLMWELHRDHGRASNYFEQAVRASPDNSHVHAAYASFLWETDDNDEEEKEGGGVEGCRSKNLVGNPIFHGAVAPATA